MRSFLILQLDKHVFIDESIQELLPMLINIRQLRLFRTKFKKRSLKHVFIDESIQEELLPMLINVRQLRLFRTKSKKTFI